MTKEHILPKGIYFIGDPAMIFKKTKAGDDLIKALWKEFYKDMNSFQRLEMDHVVIYLTRTAEGDGFYGTVGTDTGTIGIIELNQIKDDERFKAEERLRGCYYLEVADSEKVWVDAFNIYFERGYQIITNSDTIESER
jgi:hypothetical protein